MTAFITLAGCRPRRRQERANTGSYGHAEHGYVNMSTAGHAEVEAFLASLGLEQHAHNLIYNGFYTSLDALRAADYHELLECNVRPVHARLIVSNLKGAPRRASSGSRSTRRCRS